MEVKPAGFASFRQSLQLRGNALIQRFTGRQALNDQAQKLLNGALAGFVFEEVHAGASQGLRDRAAVG